MNVSKPKSWRDLLAVHPAADDGMFGTSQTYKIVSPA
jgi:hypothetical protein